MAPSSETDGFISFLSACFERVDAPREVSEHKPIYHYLLSILCD
jgi:hypothetical protein